jgi:hypothetical protein
MHHECYQWQRSGKRSGEATWDQAVSIIKEELQKTNGYRALDGGGSQAKVRRERCSYEIS